MASLLAATAATALLAGAAIASPFVFSGWADDNFIFTKVEDGTGKIISKGKSFHRVIMSFEGHHLNDPTKPWFDVNEPRWEVLENKPGVSYCARPWVPKQLLPKHHREPLNPYDNRLWPLREFGLYWVGLPKMRQIRTYRFSWNEYQRLSMGDGDLVITPRKEVTELFKVSDFSYVMVLNEAKTKDNLTVKAEFVTVVRMTNPKKALIDSDDWLVQLEAYIDRHARNLIGTYTYDELRSETDESIHGDKENFSKRMKELTYLLPEDDPENPVGTKGEIGITVKSANLEKIVLTGAHAVENEKLSIAVYGATQAAIVSVTASEAEATALRNVNNATADGIREIGKAKADAEEAQLAVLDRHPEMAGKKLMADALQSPGAGKAIVADLSGLMSQVRDLVKPAP